MLAVHPVRSWRLSVSITLATALCVLSGCDVRSGDTPGTQTAPSIGNDANATVAVPAEQASRGLTFALPSWPERFGPFPEDLPDNLTVLQGLTAEQALERAEEIHGMDARLASADLVEAATNLRWVQSPSAGVERYIAIEPLRGNDQIVLTNMQGVHAPTIADHAFGMLLALTRDLPHFQRQQDRAEWNREGSGADRIALEGRTLLVVGLGGIGREIARRGKGFGMRVLATRRSDVPPPPYVDRQGRPGDLMEFLAEADVVALAVPLTDETRGMIGTEELAVMPAGGYVVNVARGGVIQTDALMAALESGHLAGAALDVTDPEPLPADHPLWTLPNVVITPHVAAQSALTGRTWRALYVENLRRFAEGKPLLNVVDKTAGY